MNLLTLKRKEKCIVDKILLKSSGMLRLKEIGISSGTSIEFLYESPFGDPLAFLVYDAIIALRKDTCRKIIIKKQ